MKILWDMTAGWYVGIVVASVIAKNWIVPWMDWWDVLWVIVRSNMWL